MPSLSESTHFRGNHDKETENITASTARRLFKGGSQSPSPTVTAVEGALVIAAAAVRAVEIYGDKKEAGEEGENSSSPEDVSMLLEREYHGLSTQVKGDCALGRHRSMDRSKYKLRDKKSTDGQAALPLSDMTVSPMELIYPNDHLEDHEVDGNITIPDEGLEIIYHA